jgi:ribonuclease E
VYLPSGGSLVIDGTDAMTVIDVNSGKFIGSGGNLEHTVKRNNLEAAEEIVRQLRLRDVGGIVVIDFIVMVLESNRDLVLRRLTECLGRDRTKHQIAEVTSLGLVQMTRKRVGEGLLEAFSEPCAVCNGRGVILHTEPVDKTPAGEESDDDRPKARRNRGGAKAAAEPVMLEPEENKEQRLAAIAAIHRAANPEAYASETQVSPEAEDSAADLAEELAFIAVDAELVDAELVDVDIVDIAPLDPDVVDAVAVDADVVDADVVENGPAAEAEAEPAAVVHEAIEDADTEPVQRRPAPRRRRAASRPAGPPVAVG